MAHDDCYVFTGVSADPGLEFKIEVEGSFVTLINFEDATILHKQDDSFIYCLLLVGLRASHVRRYCYVLSIVNKTGNVTSQKTVLFTDCFL